MGTWLGSGLVAAALAEVPPQSPLRVASLVGSEMPAVLDPYLRAGALARRVEVSADGPTRLLRTRSRPYHDVCRLAPGAPLVSAGITEESLELLLVGPPGIPWLGEALAALAPGGVVIVSDGPTTRATLVELAELAELTELVELGSTVEVDGEILTVLRRPRTEVAAEPSRPTPPWSTLDRCACVDRGRVAAAITVSAVRRRELAEPPTWGMIMGRLGESVAQRRGDPELGVELLGEAATVSPMTGETEALSPAGVDLLLLVPHPDDETVYFGGVVAAASRAGLRLHVATLTGGEGGLDLRGSGAPGSSTLGGASASAEGLAEARAREQRRALGALGAGGCGCSGLGFADTGKYLDGRRSRPMAASEALARWGLDALVDRLVALLCAVRPRALVTMDPVRDPNYSLHAHHLACGAAALVAAGLASSRSDGLSWSLAGLWTVQPDHVGAEMPAPAGGQETQEPMLARISVDVPRKLAALGAYPSQGYSTERLIADLSGRPTCEDPPVEVLLRRARFSGQPDPIPLLLGTEGRSA